MKLNTWTPILVAGLALLFVAEPALAQEVANANAYKGSIGMAAGLGMGIAAFGGAIGQGMAARAGLEGTARNPAAAGKILVPMVLGLALIESLVLYSLVISFMLQGKI